MDSKAYEILYIILPNFSEEQRNNLAEVVQHAITEKGGSIIEFQDLGLKDFAMELRKQHQGYYHLCRFMANHEQLTNLQTKLGVTEDIFRYMIVTLDSVLTKEELADKVT
ncbi:MAG: 30S ribosomal protein S6 [Rickettsiales bacterium]|nr:30S ribosomal protein S6 [Rickettsiales bacterium]|tara:strand:+ start:128 stop:457 length:330 start_codon:yes stop_codon:yes gene_type:complete